MEAESHMGSSPKIKEEAFTRRAWHVQHSAQYSISSLHLLHWIRLRRHSMKSLPARIAPILENLKRLRARKGQTRRQGRKEGGMRTPPRSGGSVKEPFLTFSPPTLKCFWTGQFPEPRQFTRGEMEKGPSKNWSLSKTVH